MKLLLVRDVETPESTTGQLWVDGVWQCFTLEDEDRHGGPKVYGKTCIPYGTYRVTREHSAHFGRLMPYVNDVPGFSGILIHWGGVPADTLGCVLVAQHRGVNRIWDDPHRKGAHPAFDVFWVKFDAAISAGDEVILEVAPQTSALTEAAVPADGAD